MSNLRFAVLGTGFWSLYQIPAWLEAGGVELVAVYNRTVAKAEKVAARFRVARVYGDAEELFRHEQLDFVDIITEVPSHAPLVLMAARYNVPVICQKPMAPDYATACTMVAACQRAGVPFFVHENYRWQAPVRAMKRMMDAGDIGRVFRGRFQFLHALEPFVWQNQPLLRRLEKLIIADQGSHQLDLARFFLGEAHSLYCQHLRIREDIVAEDVASITLQMDGGNAGASSGSGVSAIARAIANVEMSFVTKTEWNHFPEELIYLEGTQGTLELGPDFWLRLTTAEGTWIRRCLPPHYDWADPAYDVNHASMVPLHQDFLQALRTGRPPETTGEDNLKTMRLVHAAYESAERNQVIRLEQPTDGLSG